MFKNQHVLICTAWVALITVVNFAPTTVLVNPQEVVQELILGYF